MTFYMNAMCVWHVLQPVDIAVRNKSRREAYMSYTAACRSITTKKNNMRRAAGSSFYNIIGAFRRKVDFKNEKE